MLTRADHPKTTSYKQFHMNMVTGEKKEESNESIDQSQFHSESNSEFDFDVCYIKLGTYHYIRTDNGDVDLEYNVPIVVESMNEFNETMNQIRKDLLDGEVKITIEKRTQYWDDVPSPKEEDVQKAIAICDQFEFALIEVPEPQSIDSPSWD